MIEAVRDSTVKALVITRAERGASCFLSDREFHIESPPITVIDPTGSGDVFGSAFLYRLAQSQDYEVALAFAVRSASQNCELNGVTDWGLLNFAH
jgi:sugar/nucleoside kinase (ribokinase family)